MSYFVACCSVLWSCLSCLVFCLEFVPVLCPVSPWLLSSRPGYLTGLGSLQLKASSPDCCSQDLAIWLDWVHDSSKYQALAAVLKTWPSDWIGFITAQSIKHCCSSCCLISSDFIDLCCSISFVLQPSFVQVWLRPSSCSPADCPFLLFELPLQPCYPCLVNKRHSLNNSVHGSLSL